MTIPAVLFLEFKRPVDNISIQCLGFSALITRTRRPLVSCVNHSIIRGKNMQVLRISTALSFEPRGKFLKISLTIIFSSLLC